MAQKQGGNGKQSSQSDKNYWTRLKAAGGASKRKLRNIAKQGKQAPIDYGHRLPKGKPIESVVFSGQVKENFPKYAENGVYPHFVVISGVTVEVLPRETDALLAYGQKPRSPHSYISRVSPVSSIIIAR